MMCVRSTRVRSVNVHRNMERKAGIEPATSTLATLCSATELHPQISERVRPSRFHVLQNFTRSGLSPGTSHTARIECWTRIQASRMENTSACVRRQGESPGNHHVVKQRPGRTSGAGVHARERTNPVEGFTSRTEHCFGWFSPTLREISGGLAPVGAPSGLRLRGKEP